MFQVLNYILIYVHIVLVFFLNKNCLIKKIADIFNFKEISKLFGINAALRICIITILLLIVVAVVVAETL